MEHQYPWYTLVTGAVLEQGDFLVNCPVIEPFFDPALHSTSAEELTLEGHIRYLDGLILTQSCDLVQDKIEHVIVCPVHSRSEFLSSLPKTPSDKEALRFLEEIRRGMRYGHHMLAACDFSDFETDVQIVGFHNIFTIPKALAQAVAGRSRRLRLLPPYREHLSQAFARFFMRVGLPVDIPSFR